jgi:predicted nucleic acid-binding Zn ribbon protein
MGRTMAHLPEHDHCRNCGDPVPFDMLYCSLDCYHAHQAALRSERRREILFWAACIAGVAAVIAARLLLL